jgi:hypothetical protein
MKNEIKDDKEIDELKELKIKFTYNIYIKGPLSNNIHYHNRFIGKILPELFNFFLIKYKK